MLPEVHTTGFRELRARLRGDLIGLSEQMRAHGLWSDLRELER
jgi:hypothetical protein